MIERRPLAMPLPSPSALGEGLGVRARCPATNANLLKQVLVPVQLNSGEGGPAAAHTPLGRDSASPDSCVAGEGELTAVNLIHEARLERWY